MSNIDTTMNWDDSRFFLAVARATSARKAAAKLGVSRSTILRRIAALEEGLGVRLFDRTPAGYYTTPAGDELLNTAIRIEEEIFAAKRKLAGRDAELRGKIRVTMPVAFATHLLMPAIAAFNAEHSEISLEVLPSYLVSNLASREADVAIRVSNDPPLDLVGRRVARLARCGYVCERLLPKNNGDKTPKGLSWIGWSDEPSSLQWIRETDFPDMPVGTIVDEPQATIHAACAGMGMALLPCFMGDATPGLFRMPPGSLVMNTDIWVLTHEDLRNTARIRKFTSFIADTMQGERDLIEGKAPRAS